MSENQFKKFKSLKKKKPFFYKISTLTHSQTYDFTLKRNFSFKKNRFFEKKSAKNNSATTLSSYSIHLFTSQILKRKPFQKKRNEPYFLILNFKENANLFFSFNLCFEKTKPYKFRFAKPKKMNLKWTKKENILTFCDSNQSFAFRWSIFFLNPIQINPLASENFLTSIKKKKMFNDTFFKRNAFAILNLIKIIQNYSTLHNKVKKTKFITINNIKPSRKIVRPQFNQSFSSSFFRIQFVSVIKSPVLLSENNYLVIPKSSKKQAMRLTFNKIKDPKNLNLEKLSFIEKVFKKTDFYKDLSFSKAEPYKLSFAKLNRFNKEMSQNLENNYLLSFFLKSTFFSFFTNYSIFIKNRKVRWQSSIPFLNQQIHRFLFFYQKIPFFSETLKFTSFDISEKKTDNFHFENPNDLFFTLILFKLTNVSDRETFQINNRTQLTSVSKAKKESSEFEFYLMNPKIGQNSLYFSKFFSKEKKTLNLSLAIFIKSYTQNSLINSEKIDWSYFYFEVKDQINLKDLRSFNLFIFNEFLEWSKNQHKNQPNSWILKKYWLFVENNSKFSYTPVVPDFLESGVKKAEKLEGYLCLKRFFSNFKNTKGNKKTQSNKNETYFFKKTKLHLKTWYLKKYKKKKFVLNFIKKIFVLLHFMKILVLKKFVHITLQ